MIDCLHAAIRYAKRGWPVFPLTGKFPLAGTHGACDATTDIDTVRRMFAVPGRNIGLATASMLIVDVDSYKPAGAAWLEHHERQLQFATLTQRTGRDGLHFCFELPAGDLRGKINDGVDLRRGAHQYIVAEPSIHPETHKHYRWLRDHPRSPQPVPPWLMDQIVRPVLPPIVRTTARNVDEQVLIERARRYLEKCDVAIAGSGGHQVTINVAVKLVGNFPELHPDDLLSLFDEWNRNCSPPWSPKELKHKLDDALRFAGRKGA